MKQNIRSVTSR